MTVIATIITKHFTAHASDSFITSRTAKGTSKVHESQETKIVSVPALRGAISYCGLAACPPDWSTLKWLRKRAAAAKGSSAEDFARSLARELTTEIRSRHRGRPLDRGFGICMHFSAYEYIANCWIPELFHVKNWGQGPHEVLDAFVVTRETYGICKGLSDRSEADRGVDRRLCVHNALQDGALFMFNNGDPVLFNPIASTVINAMNEIRARRVDGVSKRRRWASVAAVECGGAQASTSGSREDGGYSPYLSELYREAQECDPTWSFGKRFVGRC